MDIPINHPICVVGKDHGHHFASIDDCKTWYLQASDARNCCPGEDCERSRKEPYRLLTGTRHGIPYHLCVHPDVLDGQLAGIIPGWKS